MEQELNPKKAESRYTSGAYLPEYALPGQRYRKDATSLVALGRKAFSDGEFETALRYFKAVLLIEPANKLALYFEKKTRFKIRMLEVGKQREAEVVTVKIPIKQVEHDEGNLENCPSCDGSGLCTRCNGKGLCPNCSGTGWMDLLGKQCGMCGATGYCDHCHEERRCPDCKGKGMIAAVAVTS